MERIIAELKKQGITPPGAERPRAYVVYFGKTLVLKQAAVGLVAELRRAGIRAEMSYGDRSTQAQMKQADASGADYALLIGDDELQSGVVSMKCRRTRGWSRQGSSSTCRARLLAYLKGQG